MTQPNAYELLDFGDGRKLERFGSCLLDRLSPPADMVRVRQPALWGRADWRYERLRGEAGQWIAPGAERAETWTVDMGPFQLLLKLTPFGHVGIFPEQLINWQWISEQIPPAERRSIRLLNLFAYTGGSTLAAARAGAEVVHVDSASNVVQWARKNAQLSHLADAPIRWIVEDARRFVEREVRRGNRYEAIILDPPSYGHGSAGRLWKMEEDLPELLGLCSALLSDQARFLLFTCHSPAWDTKRVQNLLSDHIMAHSTTSDVQRLTISTRDGRSLDAGVVARVRFT